MNDEEREKVHGVNSCASLKAARKPLPPSSPPPSSLPPLSLPSSPPPLSVHPLRLASYLPPSPNFYSWRGKVVATRANLPHWNKDNTAAFVTFRLADALPREKLLALEERRNDWLAAHPPPWDAAVTREYYETFDERIQEWLDAGWGSCVLADAGNRALVEETLAHFVGERYALYAFVVMPNHIHALLMPTGVHTLSEIVSGWKQFAAHEINRRFGRVGALWQKESFDTLVRSERHFKTIVGYIKRNAPERAWLAANVSRW